MLSFLHTPTPAASLFVASFPIASLLLCSIHPSLQHPSLLAISLPAVPPHAGAEAHVLKEAFLCAFLKASDLHLKQREGRPGMPLLLPKGFDPNNCLKQPSSPPFFAPATFF